jgi:hypothetical protein
MNEKSKKQMADEFKNTVESEPIDSKALIEAIMEHIPAGMAIADARDLSVPMVSKFGLDLIGHSKEKTPGFSCRKLAGLAEFFHPDGVTPAKSDKLPLARATVKGEVVTDEIISGASLGCEGWDQIRGLIF